MLAVAVIAGVMVTVGVAPAVALTGVTASRGVGLFESLPGDLKLAPLDQKTELYAKSGKKDVLIASFFTQNREVVGEDGVAQTAKDAAVAGEDQRYFQHGGVDPTGILRAAIQNLQGKDLQGASTITQQYVKNVCIQEAVRLQSAKAQQAATDQCTDPTAGRKIREIRYAIGLEKRYSKQQILLGYLNIAGFGGQIYGIEAAANYFYGQHANELTPVQAATLLAIVKDPEHLRPDEKANLAANTARRDYILAVEYKLKMLSKTEYDAAVATTTKLDITPPKTGCSSAGTSGYFCNYVVATILNSKVFGTTRTIRQEKLDTAGWRIHTTLNIALEKKAKSVINTYVPEKSSYFALGGAAVSVQVGTGRVLAMVQNKKFDPVSTEHGTATSVNYSADTAYGRSSGFDPGSSFKLFTLLDWLKTGHTLNARVLANERSHAASAFQACGSTYSGDSYAPENDDQVSGFRSVIESTADSINNAYMTMAEQLDLCDIRDIATDFGEHQADGGKIPVLPATVLGLAEEVSPVTHTAAYAAMGDSGRYCSPIVIDSITTPTGASVPVPKSKCEQAIDPGVADAANYALHTVLTNGTASGDTTSDGVYEIGKTGTTNEAEQTWLMGTSSKVATGVWIGNVQATNGVHQNLRNVYDTPYCPVKGSTQAALERHCVWRGIMTAANKIYGGASSFPAPDPKYLYGGGQYGHDDSLSTGSVPNVIGQSEGAAIDAITGQNMSYVVGGSIKSDKPQGTIVRQSPSGGAKPDGHVTVTIYPSSG